MSKALSAVANGIQWKPPFVRNLLLAARPRAATVELPALAQDPSVTDLPVEKLSVPNVRVENDADLGKVLAGNKAVSYIDGTMAAHPGTLYPVGDARFDQQMALGVVTKLHDLYEDILGRSLHWNQGQKQLFINVRAGNEPNSDYVPGDPSSPDPMERLDRVQLYGFFDPAMGKKIYAAESKEVTAHEGGHGLTDRLRPFYSLAFNLESMAFHEGQSDIDAMILDLKNQDLVSKVLQQTRGDLSVHNYLSDIGEEFGKGISDLYHLTDPYIRTADNDPKVFRMQNWRNLPFSPDTGIGSEPHTFSQIWSGAWYDNLNGLYGYFARKAGMSANQALNEAGKIMSDLAARSFDFSPVGDVHFDEMALAQLKALKTDFGSSPHYAEMKKILEDNFMNRRILSQTEIHQWEGKESLIPALSFDPPSITRAAGTRWLAANGARLARFDASLTPQVLAGMKLAEVYTNKKGETFLNFVRMVPAVFEDEDVKDPALAPYRNQIVGQKLPMFGGLTLGFSKSGKLFAYLHDQASPSEIKDTKDYILKMILEGAIQLDGQEGEYDPFSESSRVLGTLKNQGSENTATLRRTSVCTGFKPLKGLKR